MAPLLELKSVNKVYGGVKALTDINLNIEKGEIHSIMGENGAGKSTMMKVISGVIKPTNGKIYFDGGEIHFNNIKEAENKGIFIIHQDPTFFPDITVLENIFIGNEKTNKYGFIDWSYMYKECKTLLSSMNMDESIINKPMKEISLGNQQMVLILKGVYKKSKLLILDEPTSILSFEESKKLFEVMYKLSSENVSILYISHRIAEVLDLSDRITVLKDGFLIDTIEASNCDNDKLLELMSGYKVNKKIDIQSNETNDVILKIEKLSSHKSFKNISFSLKNGQILGLYGLVGAGRSELVQAIIGERSYTGNIIFKGKSVHFKSVFNAYRQKIIYLPEDRIAQGTFPIEQIKVNMTAGLLNKICSKFYVINKKKESKIAFDNVKKYSIKIGSISDPISSLSGGNQQKVLLTRCLLHNPDVLILDEPTRGIDVKTKIEIYKLISELSKNGMSIILISSEITEILSITNSIYVMHEGEYVDFFVGEKCTEENILKAALNA